jgi:TolB-like protein
MATIHTLGPFRLDAKAGMLFRGTEPLPLGQRAIALLRMLVEQAGIPVSKDALIEAAWPGLAVEDANLTVQIAALRRVFEEEADGKAWIETLPRRGYRYVGPVAAMDDPTAAAAATPSSPPLALPQMPSIAVLPFRNMSGDPEQDYFADGLVEEIITGLSRIKWLFVIARNSSFTYKGSAVDVKQIGRELGVRYLLQGSVRKAGSRVRITAQMIEAESGGHLWAERYDRPLDDIFALQDEITLNVVGAIEPSLRKAELDRIERRRPSNLNAYDLVLRALPYASASMPKEAAMAIPLLQEAIKLEPNYGAAHAFLGLCLHHRYSRGERRPEDRAAAIHHARVAITLGSDDATALADAALVIALEERDAGTALKLFDRALELSNSNVFALSGSAVILAYLGKSELAIERAQRALRLSPFDSMNYRSYLAMAFAYFHSRRDAEAADAARSAIDSNPAFSIIRAVLAAALLRLGRAAEAKAAAQAALECQPNLTIRGMSLVLEFEATVFQPFADAWRYLGLPD